MTSLYHRSGFRAPDGWQSEKMAGLMEAALAERDEKEKSGLFDRIDRFLCRDECLLVPMYRENANYMVKPGLKGWRPMATGGRHIRAWRLERASSAP